MQGRDAAVLLERKGAVATIIMNRPERRNAVDGPMAKALRAAFQEFEEDGTLRVAVLWGAGGCFCAGADLTAVEDPARAHVLDADGDGPMGPTRMALSKPLVAAVSGHAVAGGLELALLADLRVAEESAVFGVFCRRWGVPLIDGGTVRLPRLIGESRAMDLILTGRPVGADEALAIGLANRVVPTGQARARAEELAAELARLPQACLRADRASVLHQWGRPEAEAMAHEFGSIARVGHEAMAGAARFTAGAGRHGAPA